MSFKHPRLENSPDFPRMEPPPLEPGDLPRQLCWGPSPDVVVQYMEDNDIAKYPLEIAVGIMMVATGGKCNPNTVVDTYNKLTAAKLKKSLD